MAGKVPSVLSLSRHQRKRRSYDEKCRKSNRDKENVSGKTILTEKETAGGIAADGTQSVSYTHLDVYKRQQLATTRPLVEKGWNDVTKQIGLSGRTVKPKLIITCGVSGAVQFAAGMDGAECIVAINTDTEAPIFKIANYCITEDLYRVVPALTAAVRAKQQ